MRNTKEFSDLQNQFEKDAKELIYGHRIDRVGQDEKGVPSSVFYNDGYVDTMFKVYMVGYSNGKITERLENM